jgi:hypothetical protein
VSLREAVIRHATFLCERELARRANSREVHDAVRVVTLAVAQGLADSAVTDATVRGALEEIYQHDSTRPSARV